MSPPRPRSRALAVVTSSLTVAALTLSSAPATARPEIPASVVLAPAPSQVILDWQRTSFRTVYVEQDPPTPIPVGVPYLGFTSVAMFDAVDRALARGDASGQAAAARAAHDVLAEYFPTSAAALDTDLATSLARIPDGRQENRGVRIGARAADRMIADRTGDGRNDTSIVYAKDPAPGIWQPQTASPPVPGMLGAWLGFVDPLVLDELVEVDGPDALTSQDYTDDYDEARRLGSLDSAERTGWQTETAWFFTPNVVTMIGEALLTHLEAKPLSLRRTARLWAGMHGALTDSLITAWRLKYDEGFWRPSQAIDPASPDDGNPATEPEAGWVPLVPNPPYSDYVSGHAAGTGPQIEVIRRMLGEDTKLTLRSSAVQVPADRAQRRLSLDRIESQAFHARIWGGLHFRDAMEDGYQIGHTSARRALRALR